MSEGLELLKTMTDEKFENVVFCSDPDVGLRGVIVLHDTTLGPGFGGTRIMTYPSETAAVRDAMRLSKAMTYKNAAAGIEFGGGKAVLIGDPNKVKTEAYLRSFGRHIDGLGGRYITGVDVGTDSNDMVVILRETKWVVALPESYGGCGDTTAATAFGLYHGMRAAAKAVFGDENLGSRSIAVQGTGHIGAILARDLARDGARLYLSDIDRPRVQALAAEIGATVMDPEAIYSVKCDIFSPNALGAVLNDNTIPRLDCKLIAGAANNQLLDVDRHSAMLMNRSIHFVPDFIVSAGGVMNNSWQFTGYNREKAYGEMEKVIPANVVRILADSKALGITPQDAARRLAEDRIGAVHKVRKFFLGGGERKR
jgi:leucine dehydrogenase